MDRLSDDARLAWPWLWCASNTMGRLELDYRKIMAKAFRQFRKQPTEVQFWGWVSEYRDCFLLFIYQHEGQIWGQWDTSEKFLPEYKLSADKRSPAPIAADIKVWLQTYIESKKQAASSKLSVVNNSPRLPETSQSFVLGVGVGVGSGVGIGKNLCPADAELAEVPVPTSPIESAPAALFAMPPSETKHGKAWYDEEHDRWYRAFWNHVKRCDSRKAYEKRIKQLVRDRGITHEQAAAFLLDQSVLDRKRFEPTPDWNWRQNLHPTTWLNKSMWEDEARAPPLYAQKTDSKEINYPDL